MRLCFHFFLGGILPCCFFIDSENVFIFCVAGMRSAHLLVGKRNLTTLFICGLPLNNLWSYSSRWIDRRLILICFQIMKFFLVLIKVIFLCSHLLDFSNPFIFLKELRINCWLNSLPWKFVAFKFFFNDWRWRNICLSFRGNFNFNFSLNINVKFFRDLGCLF